MCNFVTMQYIKKSPTSVDVMVEGAIIGTVTIDVDDSIAIVLDDYRHLPEMDVDQAINAIIGE